MIIAPKDYALGLLHATKSKDENEVTSVIHNFVDVLVQNNDVSKTARILDIFAMLWDKENSIVEAEIVTATTMNREEADSLENFLITLSGAKKVRMVEKIDKDILGGVIIKYGDKIMDKSLRTKIKDLSDFIKE